MKIGILTHPFYGNYGGMLQAYALYRFLQENGHQAVILKFLPYRPSHFFKAPFNYIRQLLSIKNRIRLLFLRLNIKSSLVRSNQLLFQRKGLAFQRRHVTSIWIGTDPARQIKEHGVEVIIVGSDQVWRAAYAREQKSLPFFFLDFATAETRRRSISFAASFGTDSWEGTEAETSICSKLLQEFKAVTVREESGIRICRETLGTHAERIADPTLLLNVEDYNHLIQKEKTRVPEHPYIATYILDDTPEIAVCINTVVQNVNYHQQALNASLQATRRRDRFPVSVSQWLRLIRDAKYFITDSFHGCVFAIIFNKPFVCLGNENRGSARFDSLLGTFGLKDRLTINPTAEQVQQILNTPVDWDKVNAIRHSEQERAFDFLRTHLGHE